MNTGLPYLLSVDLQRDLSLRASGAGIDHRAVDATRKGNVRALRATPALPMRTLEPHVLEDVTDDVDAYATRCLSSSSIESLFELVIATAEMRAGRAVVCDVLVALAAAPDGCTIAELADGDDDAMVSIAHVLEILGNHLIHVDSRYRPGPVLRAAIERRYPLGSEGKCLTPARPSALRAPARLREQSTMQSWRESA